MPSPYPSARVAVEAETWRAFRQAALVRGIHVSDYLAKLVEAELKRRALAPAGQITLEASENDQALVSLRAVRAAINELDDIASRLARAAYEQGGSWQDIASSLRVSEDAARREYQMGLPRGLGGTATVPRRPRSRRRCATRREPELASACRFAWVVTTSRVDVGPLALTCRERKGPDPARAVGASS
jgi:hypothetical protein